jgi:hypothetical protein
MNELLIMEKLAEIARRETPPSVEVTGLVLQNLMKREEPVISSWWLATGTLAIAVSFVLFWQIYLVPPDPLITFFESIRSVLL